MDDHSNELLRGFGSIMTLSECERQTRLLTLKQTITHNCHVPKQPWLWSFEIEGEGEHNGPSTATAPSQTTSVRSAPLSLFDSFRKKRKAVAAAAAAAAAVSTIPRTVKLVSLAVHRLVRFQQVLGLASSAPWCNLRFNENERMTTQLIASHLGLIIGDKEWKQRKGDCFSLIDSTADLSKLQNVCWVTNRQVCLCLCLF